MNTALRLRPLPTCSLSVPVYLVVRSTQDVLTDTTRLVTSRAPEPHMLNHAPVFLLYAEGGEELLNRDCIKAQLSLDESSSTPVPGSLFVYVIEEAKLSISTRVIRFLYGQLQILNYHKTDGNNVDLRKQAIKELVNNGELYTSVARDVFDKTSLKMQHYKKIFAAANLSERRLRGLIRDALERNMAERAPEKDAKTQEQKSKNNGVKNKEINVDSAESINMRAATKQAKKSGPCLSEREIVAEHQISIIFDEAKQ